jgi:hypothetical protein
MASRSPGSMPRNRLLSARGSVMSRVLKPFELEEDGGEERLAEKESEDKEEHEKEDDEKEDELESIRDEGGDLK